MSVGPSVWALLSHVHLQHRLHSPPHRLPCPGALVVERVLRMWMATNIKKPPAVPEEEARRTGGGGGEQVGRGHGACWEGGRVWWLAGLWCRLARVGR